MPVDLQYLHRRKQDLLAKLHNSDLLPEEHARNKKQPQLGSLADDMTTTVFSQGMARVPPPRLSNLVFSRPLSELTMSGNTEKQQTSRVTPVVCASSKGTEKKI